MADRADELRRAAAECLALARTTPDPQTRAALITMAQKLNDMAGGPTGNFEAVQREFNDSQMIGTRTPLGAEPVRSEPVTQQQQQIQPKRQD